MKFLITFFFLLIITPSLMPREVKVIDVETLEKIIHDRNPGILVINFWATWCRPCLEELPYFEALRENPSFSQVEVILVSLDFVSDLETRVFNFIEKRKIESTVLLLDNTDYNSWIDKVDPSWSGAIPATLIINGPTGERLFLEKQFEEGELEAELINFINP